MSELLTVCIKEQRHVDALVARYSVGWQWFRNVRDPKWHSLLDQRRSSVDWDLLPPTTDDQPYMVGNWAWRLPKYSSDMGVMWGEVERLRTQGIDFKLRPWTNGDWRADLTRHDDMDKADADTWEGFSRSAPLALATALLSFHSIRLVWLPPSTTKEDA